MIGVGASGGSRTRKWRRPATRRLQGRLASIVLIFEAVVIFLATLVVVGLNALPTIAAVIGGAGLCGALLAAAGIARCGWGVAVGWLLQAAIVATGLVDPSMVVVGALFVILWTSCMIIGARLDRQEPQKEKS